MKNRITEHPILSIPEEKVVTFTFNGKKMNGAEGLMISSVLFGNGINVFGHHVKNENPQGIFCANGQCAQCTVLVNGVPVKSCMTPLEEGMEIRSVEGNPVLPTDDSTVAVSNINKMTVDILVIGGGPSGLSSAIEFGKNNIKTLLIDDKDRLGGKLVLQTHKFFGSQKDVYAGKRGYIIGNKLAELITSFSSVDVWLNSTALAVFSDGYLGILKNNNEYVLVKPKRLLVATGAREKMLTFPGNTLPNVYGAGAFQTLVNRDLIKPAEKIFIVGGGNVGLIAGYHALQAGIDVVGLVEALPKCGGYRVHEDKLRRLGVPIYTRHTIISANGKDKVESITIGKLDDNWQVIEGTEKSFLVDTVLIAVGLDPVDEFYRKALEYKIPVWVAGDAQEIAEASAAIFTGKIEAVRILKDIGISTEEDVNLLEEKAKMMKSHPPEPVVREIPPEEEGVFPIFHCTQNIPCNPCTSICPQHQIETEEDLITNLPYFKGDKACISCGRCVAICPGLAITLVDYKKDQDNPLVTLPHEMINEKIIKGNSVTVVSNEEELGEFEVLKVHTLKQFPNTQLISVSLPKQIAKSAIGIKVQKDEISEPMDIYHKSTLPDDAIVCRCEMVSAGEIREWIKKGVTDVNELKAITRAGMGACGAKTCTSLINRLFREEGISQEQITQNTVRPIFVEVPLGVFAGLKKEKEIQ